jgi:hypothetical protein
MEASKEFENLSISARVVGPVAASKRPADEAAASVALPQMDWRRVRKRSTPNTAESTPPRRD